MNPKCVADAVADDLYDTIVASRAVPAQFVVDKHITAEPQRFGRYTEGELRSIYSHFSRRCDAILKGNRGAG